MNILAIRDQFRQASFDTAQLVQVLRSGPTSRGSTWGAARRRSTPTRIAYMGDSLGAIEGTTAAALEPRLKAWVLNVDGGGLIPELAAHSPTIGFQVAEAGGLQLRHRPATSSARRTR